MKKIFFQFFIAIFAILFYVNVYGGTEVYLDSLKKFGDEKIGIAVSEIKAKVASHEIGYISKDGVNILMNDLRLTGIFNVVENKKFIEEVLEIDKREGRVVFVEWSRIGAQALVKGEYLFSSGKLVVDLKLYDTMEGKLLISKRYSAKVRNFRRIMHSFCDDIVSMITGEPGVANTKITFVSYYRKNKEVYTADYDGYNLVRLTRDGSITLSPDWSPDGKYIAFTTYKRGNPDIHAIKIKNGARKALSKRKGLNGTPAWSPDGRHMAVTLSKDNNPEIYSMKVDGTGLKRLTKNRAIDTSPDWSPDGTKIIFVSDRSGNPQLYVMNSNGTGVKRISYNGKESHSPDWSPRGDRIVYSGRQNRYFDIYITDISKNGGGATTQLTHNAGNNENPSWSPDGRHIVFESTRNGERQIYMMHINGNDQRKVLHLKGGGYSPSWSPRLE